MNAIKTDVSYSSTSGFSAPPILVFGDSEASIGQAVRTIEASGHRLGDAVSLKDAKKRLDRQSSAAALWVEVASDTGNDLDLVLEAVNRAVAERRCGAVVSAPLRLIDAVAALA